MQQTNVPMTFSAFLVCLLVLCFNQSVTANDDCRIPSLPEKGYANLGAGVIVSNNDIEDHPSYVRHMQYISFVCYEGYKLLGEKEVRCMNGEFTADFPECMQLFCKPPPIIENAYYENDELNQPFVRLTKLQPKCSEGFRLKLGSRRKIMCVKKGTNLVWSQSPICEVNPKCEDPGVPLNGTRTGKRFYAGDEVSFVCDPKFKMIGVANIKCLEDGTWSSRTPFCKKIPFCGDPGTPVSGFRFGESFYEGDKVSFSCGFEEDELIGNRIITCGRNGLWSSPRPRCKPPSTCPDPPESDKILYKSPKRTRDFHIPGDEVVVSCEEGYKLDSNYDTIHCTLEDEKKVPEESSVGYEDYYEYNQEEIKVPEVKGPYWKESFPLCKEILCKKPKFPLHGFIHELKDVVSQLEEPFRYGFTLNYGCKEGYQIIGAHFSVCLEAGWTPSNSEVRCKKIKCPAVNVPDNGYFSYLSNTEREIGDIVEFGCNSDFNLTGSKSRECLENGQWSGDLPTCKGSSYCPDPGIPLGAHKSGHNYSRGSVVRYTCGSGETLVGSEIRLCQDNGTWSGTEVFCRKFTDFDRPLEMQFRLLTHLDSSVLLTDSMTAEKYNPLPTENRTLPPVRRSEGYGRMLDVSYNKGNLVLYFIFDSSASVGVKNFHLSIEFVKALVKRIQVSEEGVRVGASAFSKNVDNNHAFPPNEYSNTADVLEALDRLKFHFKGGGTNIYGALENFETAVYPLLTQTLHQPKTHIFLLTDGNYNTGGDPTPLAAKMNERGVEFSCVGISGKKEANMLVIEKIASKPTNIYTLKDYDHMKWMVDQVLTNKVDYSRCGLAVKSEEANDNKNAHGRIFGGKITKTYWPWMAMLTGPTQKSFEMEGFCGGSLIDRKWILTAAHCMFYENRTERGDKDIHVRLGYTKGDDKTFTQTIASKKIFKHDSFTFGSFDADVALIMLEKPADYEKRIRPVCLSPAKIPDDSTLYVERSAGWAIGYGKFKDEKVDKVEEFRDLREVALDIGEEQKCADGLKKSPFIYTKNMFCAGGSKGVDTCKGDSGSPFMKHQFHAEGTGYWTQTGIVSFSPNTTHCGLAGVYGYYTKVSEVRDWIDKIIRTYSR